MSTEKHTDFSKSEGEERLGRPANIPARTQPETKPLRTGVGPKGENLIFLISQPRSGSTLLQRILAGHPEIFATAEPWIMLHPLHALKQDGYSAVYNADLARIGLRDFCKCLPGGEEDYVAAVRGMAVSLYNGALIGSGKTRFLDKTPRYYFICQELRRTFPAARFIFLLRNPLAVVASILQTWVKDDWQKMEQFRYDLLAAPALLDRAIKEFGDAALVVRYEELAVDPVAVVGRLCRELGLAFQPEMLQYGSRAKPPGSMGDQIGIVRHDRPVTESVAKWQQTLASPQARYFAGRYLESLDARTLTDLGYAPHSLQEEWRGLKSPNVGAVLSIEWTNWVDRFLGRPRSDRSKPAAVGGSPAAQAVPGVAEPRPRVPLEVQTKAVETREPVHQLLELARRNLEAGRATDAAKTFFKILQTDENNVEALFGIGLCFLRNGNNDMAWKSFERVLRVQPSHALAQENLQAMRAGSGRVRPGPARALVELPAMPGSAGTAGGSDVAAPGAGRTPGPLVSAIVSTYNSERFMRGCLEDLTSQTLFVSGKLEIIIIDSGSDQNERGIVEEFQKRHSNIIYLRTERETVYAAWNRGAQMARGTFLTNANTDDRHRPDATEQMARVLEANPLADLVFGDSYVTGEPNAPWGHAAISGRFFWPDFDARLLFDVCTMGPHPLWRRSVHDKLGFFDPSYHSAGDYEFWLRMAAAGCKMIHLPDVVGLYLERPESVSLSDGNLSWQESEKARNRHWPAAWGKRPATAWRSFQQPIGVPGDKPLRVLLACDYFWPSVGGVELYVEDLARNLQAAGCTVEVACRRLPQRTASEHAGLRLHEFECVNDYGFALADAALGRLRTLLAGKKIDCVLVLAQPDNWLEALLQEANSARTRVVFLPSINEMNPSLWRERGTTAKVARFLRVPDELVAVTEHGLDIRFINQVGRIAAYIPHAVEQDADQQNFRSYAGFDPDRPLLVMVANFWPVKNHLELLKVLEQATGEWQLAIIGHRVGHLGEYHDQVARQAARDPRVKLLGGLPRGRAASAIRDADLLLVPSKGESAGPLVVLQAMSYGTAWVATPQCNAVADEAGGIVTELCKFPEVIRALLAAPGKRHELGQTGYRHWERCFTWKQSIPAFLAVLRGVGSVPDLRMPADLRQETHAIQNEIASLCQRDVGRPQSQSPSGLDGAPRVTVIIPTYNRSATLIQCLEALARQTVPPSQFEVIVSDDGSTDDTPERVAAFRAPFEMRYLRQKNSGPAAARNRAIEQARGYYLYILNDDAILEPDALALHLAAHESRPGEKIAVLGRFAFPSILTATPFGHALEHSDLLFNFVHLKAGGKHDFNSFFTCNLTLPRQAVIDAGLFDEVFTGPAAEDIELGYRLSQRGYQVLYEPKSVAWHHHQMTPEGFCRVHRTRGQGAITLLLKQPEAPWYRGTDFATLRASLDRLAKTYPTVEHVVGLLNKVNADAIPDHKTLTDRATQMLPLLRFLQEYHELEGMLSNPRLPELVEVRRQQRNRSGKASAEPAVSVVVTCYNYARFLTEAVESVAAQTFRDFELIVVNDGSTDNSGEVADQLAAKYKDSLRILAIHTRNTGQPAATRNTGIAAARGRYVLCLDADDKIDSTFLEKTVPVLEREAGVGVVYSHIRHFGDRDDTYQCGDFELAALMRDNVLPYCALYRRKIWERLGGYRLNIRGYEDWDFWLGACELGWKGRLIPEPLFFYRKHGSGLLAAANPRREALLATLVANHPQSFGPPLVAEKARFLEAAGKKPFLRVTYLISSILGVTGGNQTLLRHAEELRRHGHDVTIVTYSPKPDWFKFEMRVVQVPAGQPMSSCVPPSDVVVATYFINAMELRAVQAKVKVYYAQGDQFVFGDTTMADTPENRQFRELSRASYLLPGIRFVPNSNNLARAVEELCGRKPDGILPVCTDQTIFRPLQRSVPGSRFRLLIVGPDSRGTAAEPLLFKGIEDIRAGLEILAGKYPHFTPVRMSGTGPDIFARVPCEFYIAPSDEMKTVLFGTSHIHIYASHYDSCPRPPQEAMAAGCAVVCTATSGAMEYCRDGENVLLVPVQSPAAIAEAVGRLIHDHALRDKLVQGGLATARPFPREREWNEWEAMLYRFMDEADSTVAPAVVAQSVSPAKPAEKAKAPIAIKLPPCALLGHLGPARELLKQKKLAAAWESAQSAVQARPFHPEGFVLLGEIAQAAGDGVSALLCGKHARQLAPDWKPARKFCNASHKGSAKLPWLVPPVAVSGGTPIPPRLSVCLIVKNEEEFLNRCLSSVRGLANQIIVVDTGSTDRTIEIAREHGAQVHPFTWCDDFAAARNAALAHATGDWVLCLDADEELLPDQEEVLRAEMEAGGVMAFRLPIIDKGREQQGCSYVPRLFRNAPGLFFLGRVHEQAFSSIEVRCREWSLKHDFGKTTILHHGYVKEVVESRDKVARNLRLLEKAIEELPGEPNLLMNLGLELVRSGRREEGIRRYWEAVAAMAKKPKDEITPELRETLLSQLTTHLIGGREFAEVVRLWELPAVKSGPRTASHHFGLGLACMELKRPLEAAEQMRQCLAKRSEPVLSPINPEILKAGPHHCLALCLVALGEKPAAEKAFAAALAEDPKARRAGIDFARFLARNGKPLDALKELNRLVADDPNDVLVWHLGGQIALSRSDFLEFARDWTGEAVKHFPEHTGLLTQRGEALLLTQKPEAALPFWLKAHSPNSPRQVAALALCEFLAGDFHRRFAAAEEAAVSQELVKWYRQLIAVGAHSCVHQLHDRMEQIRAVAPCFVRTWEAATKQARAATAAA